MSVLVISNPRTRRAGRRLEALRQALPETEVLSHRVTDDLRKATALMTATPWEAGDTLVINGGDGTAQRMLTALLRSCPPERRPRVALLPGGTTNMTAFDLNRHRSYQRCLKTLQSLLHTCVYTPTDPPAAGSCIRPLVHVDLPDGEQFGFFFGAGTIVQGIEYFNQRIRPGGGRHELGAGLALLRTAWGIARRQPPFAEPLRLSLPAASLAEAADRGDAERWHSMAARLCLVTSLNRLFLGIRPYWNQAEASLRPPMRSPMRATLVEADAVRFLRSLPRLLRGRPGDVLTTARGYHSVALGALALRFAGPFTLDGELFASSGDTMCIRASEPLRFLML